MPVTAKSTPALKRYKNRKKTLRLSQQTGKITAVQRRELQQQAYQAYKDGELTAAAAAQRLIHERADKFLNGGGSYPHNECDPLCLAAATAGCDCRCGGVNHGAATPPAQRNFKTIQERAQIDAQRQTKREAKREAKQQRHQQRENKKQLRAQQLATPRDANNKHPHAPHGTERGYNEWRCRCDLCQAFAQQAAAAAPFVVNAPTSSSTAVAATRTTNATRSV